MKLMKEDKIDGEFTKREWNRIADEERRLKKSSGEYLIFMLHVIAEELDKRFKLKRIIEERELKK